MRLAPVGLASSTFNKRDRNPRMELVGSGEIESTPEHFYIRPYYLKTLIHGTT